MARETSATECGALSSLTGRHVFLQGTKAAAHCCDARRKHGARVRLSGLSAVACRSWQPSGPTFPPTGSTRSAPSSPDSPEVQLCVSVTGTHNLVLSVRQRSLADIQRLDAALARRFPNLRVAERRVSLRTVKRMGRILDADGRADRAVPVDVWRDPTPASCRQRPFRPPCARETSGNRTGCSILPPRGAGWCVGTTSPRSAGAAPALVDLPPPGRLARHAVLRALGVSRAPDRTYLGRGLRADPVLGRASRARLTALGSAPGQQQRQGSGQQQGCRGREEGAADDGAHDGEPLRRQPADPAGVLRSADGIPDPDLLPNGALEVRLHPTRNALVVDDGHDAGAAAARGGAHLRHDPRGMAPTPGPPLAHALPAGGGPGSRPYASCEQDPGVDQLLHQRCPRRTGGRVCRRPGVQHTRPTPQLTAPC